ncbi:MAG: 1,4-alpha-glucan branching protein GlgB [Alphaproteobacteria bacterium]|nr:1,4-alpha-glucan branching protein GlgB [Alphaproteobacteria bacterium]
MENTLSNLLSKKEVEAIINGDYVNVFAVLGIHKDKGTKEVFIRTYQPDTNSVELLDAQDKSLGFMKKLDERGFYQINLGAIQDFHYKFKIENSSGDFFVKEDSYRFPSTIGDIDVYLLSEGTHLEMYKKLGAHEVVLDGVKGVSFAVWAPNAKRVSVVGNFNNWDGRVHVMRKHISCGIWDVFIPQIGQGEVYKFEIKTAKNYILLKSDPLAFYAEKRPHTASVVYDIEKYDWEDKDWMKYRKVNNSFDQAMSIYEVHLGSWRRNGMFGEDYLSYRELAERLVPYVTNMGYTHVELLPPTEHPFDGSWGYQVIGMFAPTSRFGTPEDFKFLVDKFHQAGIGVIIDWVPAHFPKDAHGLAEFDGTALYEHADPRKGEHNDWGTKIYNFGRTEVYNFLCASALFWLKEYHIDGLRVDAVASMLYLDYSRKNGEWIPNVYGGNENLEAISFLRRANELAYTHNEGAITIAEESTAWPMVSRPTDMGGLGFGLKWNMGWMNDTLRYIAENPVHRKYHHGLLTFGLIYAFNENFVLPISHDEVVHGKGSMLSKMPGDEWQKFANLRAYYGFMFTHPGKKLMFMGCEFAQDWEWNANESLRWHLLDYPMYKSMQDYVRDLNFMYRANPSLYEQDFNYQGFEWIDHSNADDSVVSYIRKGNDPRDYTITICNFTPVVRTDYRIGVNEKCAYQEIFNSDDVKYWGSGVKNEGEIWASDYGWNFKSNSIKLTLPPLSTIILKPIR